jgi:hypothetical protein
MRRIYTFLALGAVAVVGAACTQSSSLAHRAVLIETPNVQSQCVVRGEGVNAFSAAISMTPDSVMVPNGNTRIHVRCTGLDNRSFGTESVELNRFGARNVRVSVHMQPGVAR